MGRFFVSHYLGYTLWMKFPAPPPAMKKPIRPSVFDGVKGMETRMARRVVRVSMVLWAMAAGIIATTIVWLVGGLHGMGFAIVVGAILCGFAFGSWSGKMVVLTARDSFDV